MRSSKDIAQEIAVTARRLQALQVEHINARLAERDEVVRLFCRGRRPGDIGALLGLSRGAVCGILYRAGGVMKNGRKVGVKLDDNLRVALRHGLADASSNS